MSLLRHLTLFLLKIEDQVMMLMLEEKKLMSKTRELGANDNALSLSVSPLLSTIRMQMKDLLIVILEKIRIWVAEMHQNIFPLH